ncbi:hypothetical protein AB0O28_09210 [Microbispora sp. NPDC088329]|uniref:ATP-binding protein n=1 Tax=Microbispora sp. NPDC088329 TaxID=3154869 RepID=UPI003421987F
MSVRLKLTLSYAAFLMFAGALLLAAVWVFLLSYVPDSTRGLLGVAPNRSLLLRMFAPAAAAVLAFLLVFGLVGGRLLAGRMLAPLTRITDATRMAANGSLTHRIRLEGRKDDHGELVDRLHTVNARAIDLTEALITTSVRPETVMLTVESSGEKLPPESVATLTEPFQRGTGRIRGDHAGVGLGLANRQEHRSRARRVSHHRPAPRGRAPYRRPTAHLARPRPAEGRGRGVITESDNTLTGESVCAREGGGAARRAWQSGPVQAVESRSPEPAGRKGTIRRCATASRSGKSNTGRGSLQPASGRTTCGAADPSREGRRRPRSQAVGVVVSTSATIASPVARHRRADGPAVRRRDMDARTPSRGDVRDTGARVGRRAGRVAGRRAGRRAAKSPT